MSPVRVLPARSSNKPVSNAIWVFAFVFLHALILTLSPAVRMQSWLVDYRWAHWIGFLVWASGFLWLRKVFYQKWHNWNEGLFLIASLLSGWGLLTIFRLNIYFGLRQTLWLAVAYVMGWLIFKFPSSLDALKKYKYITLLIGLIMVGLTFFFGTYPSGDGPRLWLGCCGIYFQPSEMLKVILILYLAAYLSEKKKPGFTWLDTLLPTVILAFTAVVILVGQRDLGTALIFIAIYVLMIFNATNKKRVIGLGILILAVAGAIGYGAIDLIRIRIQSWILPWTDAQAGAYQIIQSIIAIAAGGLFGTGIGLGSPKSVPIAHSDFIFSAIAEETGLIGSAGLILLLIILLYQGMHISLNAKNRYHSYLAYGLTVYLITQSLLIIGGNIRVLPITGVTLPFVSYGGSSLISSYLAVYFLLMIHQNHDETDPNPVHPVPARITSALFSLALFVLVMVNGWWAVVRSQEIQLRADNPRRIQAGQYVRRGSILDRNDRGIATTEGDIGSFTRNLAYPPLSNTIGYVHPQYGKSGLESEYDDYLSGFKGYPAFNLWANYLLYDQPPDGRDIRLTIDLSLQEVADQLLDGKKGAVVIMHAGTGEILTLASHPYFNANEIITNWDLWKNDPDAPLLNRATQGAYPVGTLASPFLLIHSEMDLIAPDDPSIRVHSHGKTLDCRLDDDSGSPLLMDSIQSGCPSALFLSYSSLDPQQVNIAVEVFRTGSTSPFSQVSIPQMETFQPTNAFDNFISESQLRLSPLQVASASTVFSNKGSQVDPQILLAVNTYLEGWVITTSTSTRKSGNGQRIQDIADSLQSDVISGWEFAGKSLDKNGNYTWYLAGTPMDGDGRPVVVTVVMESVSDEEVINAGRRLYSLAN